MADEEKTPFGILPKITTKGDIGVAGLGLALGYIIDAAFHPFGIPPLTASLYSAAAAVGIKNSIESCLEWRDMKKEKAKASSPEHRDLRLERAANALFTSLADAKNAVEEARDAGFRINVEDAERIVDRFRLQYEYWQLGLIVDEELRKGVSILGRRISSDRSMT
jgi:hypothetical protein